MSIRRHSYAPIRAVSIVAVITTFSLGVISNAAGYKLRANSQGTVLVWNQKTINVEIDTAGVPTQGGAADAVRAGLVVWTSNGVPHKVNSKLVNKSKQAANVSNDGRNVIQWVSSGWKYGPEVVGMTISMYKQSSGVVSETDIVLNARDHGWSANPAPGSGLYDIQNVVTHEAGHLFGLGHSAVKEATMFATTPVEETAKRSLSSDDLAGIAALIQEHNRRGPLRREKNDDPGPMAQSIETQTSPPLPMRNTIGCSAGKGSGPGPWWPVLLLLVGLGFTRRRVVGLLAALTLLVIAPNTARATVVQRLGLKQLAARSSAAVKGVVVGSRSYRQEGLIYTDYSIRVARCYRGTCQKTVTLHTLGGQVGDLVMEVEGTPRPGVGQTVVVLGRRTGGKLVAIGLAQGFFTVQRSDPTVLVRDLRGLDLVAAGRVRSQGGVERLSLAHVEALLGAKPGAR